MAQPGGQRERTRFERAVLASYRVIGRLAGRRLGATYERELCETLELRLLDSRSLPVGRRLGFVSREWRSMLRVGLGTMPSGARLERVRPQQRSALTGFSTDLRMAGRQLWRAPGFAALTIAILALGIGANTAIFSIVDAVLLRPLPYTEPDRLMRVGLQNPSNRFNASVADFLALRQSSEAFEGVAAFTTGGSTYYPQSFTITLTADPEREVVNGSWVSAGFFATLGVRPLVGRGIEPGEDDANAPPVVVLSYAFGARYFGSAEAAVGRTLEINDTSHLVVGVMPPGFRPPWNPDAQLWPAFRMLEPGRRGPFFIAVLGRLREGISLAQAEAALVPVAGSTQTRWSDSFNGDDTRYALTPLHEDVSGSVQDVLWLLLGAVAFVLLIALANVGSLMLARTVRRQREFALRSALGAGRRRIGMQLLAEGLCLAAAGTVAGLVVAQALLSWLVRNAPVPLPRQDEIGLDTTVLAFAAGLSALVAVSLTLLTARRVGASDSRGRLRQGGRSSTDDQRTSRLRSLLVFGEVALAVPLLVGALLMGVSLLQLQRVEPGFVVERVLTMRIALPVQRYESIQAVINDLQAIVEAGALIPGVDSLALSSSLPPSRLAQRNNFIVRDDLPEPGVAQPVAHYLSVTPAYFETLGIPLVAGRGFAASDGPDGDPVAVVDRAFAARYLGDREALGRDLQFGGCTECPWATVVGVVGNVRYDGVEHEPEPTIYVPVGQDIQPVMYVTARTQGDPAALTSALRATAFETIPGVAATEVRTARGLLDATIDAPRQRTFLLGLFALLAVVLAAVGIYGVVASFVARHTREIGLRMAVGATRASVIRMVLGRTAWPLGAGLLVGGGLALLSGRLLEGFVHGVATTSPPIILGAMVLLAAIALAGTLVPARRASRIDPVESLRAE